MFIYFFILIVLNITYAHHFPVNQTKPNLSLFEEFSKICPQLEDGYTGIIIEGHTDKRGSELYNLKLGKKRAEVAKAYLSDICGVDVAKIKTVSMGELEATGIHHEDRKVVVHILQKNQKTIVIKEKEEKTLKAGDNEKANSLKSLEPKNNYFFSLSLSNPYTNIKTEQTSNWAQATIERSWAIGVQAFKRFDSYYFGIGVDSSATMSIGIGLSL